MLSAELNFISGSDSYRLHDFGLYLPHSCVEEDNASEIFHAVWHTVNANITKKSYSAVNSTTDARLYTSSRILVAMQIWRG